MTKTNIHGTAFEGKAEVEATEEQQTLSSCKRAKYVAMCDKTHQAITEALAELKVRSR